MMVIIQNVDDFRETTSGIQEFLDRLICYHPPVDKKRF